MLFQNTFREEIPIGESIFLSIIKYCYVSKVVLITNKKIKINKMTHIKYFLNL